MSSKPFQRKDLKHDEFITLTGRATSWLMQRRRRIGWGLLVVALVAHQCDDPVEERRPVVGSGGPLVLAATGFTLYRRYRC